MKINLECFFSSMHPPPQKFVADTLKQPVDFLLCLLYKAHICCLGLTDLIISYSLINQWVHYNSWVNKSVWCSDLTALTSPWPASSPPGAGEPPDEIRGWSCTVCARTRAPFAPHPPPGSLGSRSTPGSPYSSLTLDCWNQKVLGHHWVCKDSLKTLRSPELIRVTCKCCYESREDSIRVILLWLHTDSKGPGSWLPIVLEKI